MTLVLGIESSCDETAAAVVDDTGRVISDVVASQIDEHRPYGGVVPELASRAHLRSIGYVIEQALAPLDSEGRGLDHIAAIAVTNGPGLAGALLVGVQTAKALAFARRLPLVGVDHLHAHLLAVFLRRREDVAVPAFPFVALLVSGGHTALYEVRSPLEARMISQTRDDAAGEAFDKVAKLLGLGYPGGPLVDKLAKEGNPLAVELPRPLARKDNLDFSFSGLKTAVAHHVRKHGVPATRPAMADLCASFQAVAVESLARKSLAACATLGIPRLVVGGGVAANRGLRERLAELATKRHVELFVPELASCTDNAAMIAYAGLERFRAGLVDGLDLGIYSRGAGVRRGAVR